MARTRLGPRRRPANINFDLRRVAAAKEIRRGRVNAKNIKIKVLLPQGKNVEVKKRGQVVRRMRVRRKSIFPAAVRNRTYGYFQKIKIRQRCTVRLQNSTSVQCGFQNISVKLPYLDILACNICSVNRSLFIR